MPSARKLLHNMIADVKTLAMIDYEIDAYHLRAKAEAALDAISHEPNPWVGAAMTLKSLEDNRSRLVLEEHGRRLVALLNERAELRQHIDALEPQLRAQKAAARELLPAHRL